MNKHDGLIALGLQLVGEFQHILQHSFDARPRRCHRLGALGGLGALGALSGLGGLGDVAGDGVLPNRPQRRAHAALVVLHLDAVTTVNLLDELLEVLRGPREAVVVGPVAIDDHIRPCPNCIDDIVDRNIRVNIRPPPTTQQPSLIEELKTLGSRIT